MTNIVEVVSGIVNNPRCILSDKLQEKCVAIANEESKKMWAENKRLLRQMEEAKKSVL